MRRIGIGAMGAILIVAACSSGGGSVPTSPSGGTNAPDVTTPDATSGPPDAAPDGGASVNPDEILEGFKDEGSSAVVVIGDQRFEFTDLYCVTIGGALGAQSISGDPRVNISIPPADWETSAEDWQPPSIRLRSDEPYSDFRADPEMAEFNSNVQAGMSQIDSFTTDGYHADGQATFLDTVDYTQEPTPVTGSFDVTCPRP